MIPIRLVVPEGTPSEATPVALVAVQPGNEMGQSAVVMGSVPGEFGFSDRRTGVGKPPSPW